MTNPRVLLAVGHGRTPRGTDDPGAVGNGWTEQTAGDVIVREAAHVLGVLGAIVRHEADSDDPNYVGTTDSANGWGADVVVAVHHDIANAPEGTFAYHAPGSTRGRALALSIVAEVEHHGRPTRAAWLGPGQGFADGPVAPRSLYVLTRTAMPAVLVEVGPIGHASLDTEAELRQFGQVLALGIAAYLDLADRNDRQEAPVPSPDALILIDPTEGVPDALAALSGLVARPDERVDLTCNLDRARQEHRAGTTVWAIGRAAALIEGDRDLAGANRLRTLAEVAAQAARGWTR